MKRILRKRLLICVGPGGVGKTTTAAALAIASASTGKRVAVITFDPSRRLKDALGLKEFSGYPVPVKVGEDIELDALALDTKRTFDALVARFAADEDAAERIFNNRLYQEVSNELSGSAEYMAMEKLHELLHGGRYDAIVVDTPPSSHAQDLLAAPNRLSALLASRAVDILQAPASILGGGSAFGRMTLSAILRALERWTGIELLQDLADFVTGFQGMIEGFHQRAHEIGAHLRGPDAAFVMVTTPEVDPIHATLGLHRELRQEQFPIAGIIANRVMAFPSAHAADLERWQEPLRAKLRDNLQRLHALSVRDQRALSQLHQETGAPLIAVLPMSAESPSTLAHLRALAEMIAD